MTNIFVFGSNLAGRHGKGSAAEAVRNHGAKYGCGIGPQGKSYAIPTKDRELRRLSLEEIAVHVKDFIWYAKNVRPQDRFDVVEIGCGFAGYTPQQIAPLFVDALELDNVLLSPRFRRLAQTSLTTNKED